MIFSSAVVLFHLISSELKRSGLEGFEVHKTQKVGDIQQTPWEAGRVTGPLPRKCPNKSQHSKHQEHHQHNS